MRKRTRIIVLTAVPFLIILPLTNIYYLGRAAAGLYAWRCSRCSVFMQDCPGKKQRLLDVPSTYAAHVHDWVLERKGVPDRWSRWKPWQWLAFMMSNSPEVFEHPDPHDVFRTANANVKYSHPDGLLRLSQDDRYEKREWASLQVEEAKERLAPSSASKKR